MIALIYAPVFVKQFNKLEPLLQEEVVEKIDLFRHKDNHRHLKVHKLHGSLENYYSFSINYQIRIVFEYLSAKEVALLTVGDHDVYR